MTEHATVDQLANALSTKLRLPLAQLPTPLVEAPRLSQRLGVRIYIKRDDQTGLALGGNKARKLEFLIAAAQATGSDVVITTGGSQSNHARMTAAACRLVGMECHLILDRGQHPELQGNLLLDRVLDARVQLIEDADPAAAAAEIDRLVERLRGQGRNPYVIPRGGSVPTGAIGYAAFVPELLSQLEAAGVSARYLYLPTGSTGTHSGVLAGLTATGHPLAVQGISVSRNSAQQTEKILALSNATLRYMEVPGTVTEEQINVDDRYRGPGYGHPTSETMEAIEIAAREEAIILDPVYTGKAMAGLIGHAREGRFTSQDTVVFLHTGGAPALFAYNQEVVDALEPGRA